MMLQMDTTQVVQLIAWITALIELILGLYILILNTKHSANRHVSFLLILIAINTYAQGQLINAEPHSQIDQSLLMLATTTPAIQPGLLLIAIVLLKPQWLKGRGQILRWLLYLTVAFPIILTIIDNFFHTNIWYTGFPVEEYQGSFLNLSYFTQGTLGSLLRVIYIYTITLATAIPIFFIAIFDKSISKLTRKLAYTLLSTQVIAIIINFVLFLYVGTYLGILITSSIFALGYAYAAFWQLVSERRLQSGRLQLRLTALILAITIPLEISIATYIVTKTRELLQLSVLQRYDEVVISYFNFQVIVLIVIGIGISLLGILTSLTIRQAIQPVETLTKTAAAISQGDLSRVAPVETEDEFGLLAQSFNQMTEQLLELIGNLEKRVSERTIDLEKRSTQLQAAADVGQAASSVLDINQLIGEVVGVIRDRFNLYYVGLFLLDEEEWAYLRAGTGKAGKEMLAREHRIQVGEGMIGWAIANAQPRVASEAEEDIVRLATSELPGTRSEAAIPLQVRGNVVGAITVQDTHPDTFDESTISTLQTMADLVSIAIDNAKLYTESQEALVASRRAYGETTSKAWMGETQKSMTFKSKKADTDFGDNGTESITHGEEYIQTFPLKVRDITIGELITRKPKSAGDWHPEEISLLETVAEQLGIALDSARLYDETQRRAASEKLTREVTNQMRQSLDIETVLRIAAAEFKRALDLSEVEIRMGLNEGENA
jgi:GAF domain-containing protein